MSKPKKLSSLKQETKKWYKKLKDQGFVDLEVSEYKTKHNPKDRIGRHTFNRVDDTHTSAFNKNERLKTARIVHTAKQSYFYHAEHFLNSYDFETEQERVIWEYHVNGLTIRDTAKVLAKVGIKLAIGKIWRTVRKLSVEMKKNLK